MDRIIFDNATFGVADSEFLKRMGFDGDEFQGLHAEQVANGHVQDDTNLVRRLF